jgi:hypothetical protein
MWNIPDKFSPARMVTKRLGTDFVEETQPLLVVDQNTPTAEDLIKRHQKITVSIKESMRIRMQIVARYLEYSITAPLFYICILSVLVVGPPYWMYGIGYMCIQCCCWYGIPMHIMHIQERLIKELTETPGSRREFVPIDPTDAGGASSSSIIPIPAAGAIGHSDDMQGGPGGVPLPSAGYDPNPFPQAGDGPNPFPQAGYDPNPLQPSGPILPDVLPAGSNNNTSDNNPAASSDGASNQGNGNGITTGPGSIVIFHGNNGASPSDYTSPGSHTIIIPPHNATSTIVKARKPVIFAAIGRNKPKYKDMLGSEGKIEYVQEYNNNMMTKHTANIFQFILALLMIGPWRVNWVAKMQYLNASWICLSMGLGILIYAARGLLLTSLLPVYVVMSMWNLLVFYIMFGLVACIFYYVLEFHSWDYLDVALDLLSVSAKSPIVFFLVFGYWSMPSNLCFGNYYNTVSV